MYYIFKIIYINLFKIYYSYYLIRKVLFILKKNYERDMIKI